MLKTFADDFSAPTGLTSVIPAPGAVLGRVSTPSSIQEPQAFGVRALDLCVAMAAIVLFAPLMLMITMIVRIAAPGPVLFRQARLGRNGRVFTCYKFRTMYADADQRLEELLATCDRSSSEWRRDQKLRDDPRIVPMGRLLRRLSLDELPQLFNVLLGDMSVVGPRPIVPSEAWRYGRHIASYSAVRPGITGLWQISGRNHTTYRRRVACDVMYARSKSVGRDVEILLKTVPVLLTAHGAY